MKQSKSVLIICALLCLSFEAAAQYKLTRRGEPSPYDSSVNIEISEYRLIRNKVLTYDTLRRRIQIERLNFEVLEVEFRTKAAIMEEVVKAKDGTIARQDTTIADLRKVSEDAIGVAKKLQVSPIPIVDATAKVGGGILIGLLISLIFK
jgi:hypothetical protein